MLDSRTLDYIAITDHNTVDFALEAKQVLGDRIIVGEEIATAEGELIGLYLQEAVEPGLSLHETAELITRQGGVVYVPHPFETVRKGISATALDKLASAVAIVEIHNGRAVAQNRSRQAEAWTTFHHIPGAAASDAHGPRGWGRTYSSVDRTPTAATLPQLLAAARFVYRWPGVVGILYPKLNRLRKGVGAL